MKVALLGAGGVGEVIAKHLTVKDTISLTLVDVDESRISRVRRKLANRRVRTECADLAQKTNLKNVIAGHDLVINAASPAFNLSLMEACLEADANYIDLASDDVEAQIRLFPKWKRKGLLALVAVGEDPGLSNIYACYAAERLDEVISIKVRDGEYAESEKYPIVPLFSPAVFFREVLSSPFIFENSRFKRLAPLSGCEIYPFPEPIGPRPVYLVNHEEVHTLPRFIGKKVRYVDFKLVLPDRLLVVLKTFKTIGLFERRKLVVGEARVAPFDVFLSMLPSPAEVTPYIKGHAGIVVEVAGKRKGRTVTHKLFTTMSHEEAYKRFGCNATSYITGTVPAVIVSLLSRGRLKGAGVFVPEQLNPSPIIRELKNSGIISYHEALGEVNHTRSIDTVN